MEAVRIGVTEIDRVVNIGWVLDGRSDDVGAAVVLKVSVEAALLAEDQRRRAAEVVVRGGGDFVKTSTGLGGAGGATVDDVRLLKAAVGERAAGLRPRVALKIEVLARGAAAGVPDWPLGGPGGTVLAVRARSRLLGKVCAL